MAKTIRKHRFSIAGVALPLFFFAILGAISVGVFPGWIKPVYSLPGDQCTSAACDSVDPLLSACNACNGEFCSFNSGAQQFQCAIDNGGGPNFNPAATPQPACPLDDPTQPGCWTSCTSVVNINNPSQFCTEPVCAANDSFCDGISGGTSSNDCRSGVCQPSATPDPLNPSGCDYDLTTGPDCRNCIPTGLATLENCGNGICEPDEGEACDTCAVDCLLPGFTDTCPLTSGTVIAQACANPAATIIFDGPPWNVPFSQECEDGDLCTNNACVVGAAPACSSTPKSCDPDADFCCPAGCSAPAAGGTCRQVTGAPIAGCDPDCYVPEQCIPTPSPTPTPPVFGGCLEGSGVFAGNSGSANCKGFSCALNRDGGEAAGTGLAVALLGALALVGALRLRRDRA